MSTYNEIFGYNKPIFTRHFLERYAMRLFNVPEKYVDSWLILNKHKIVSDTYKRLNKCDILKLDELKQEYLHKKYGNDVIALKNNNIVFIIREYKFLVTCFNTKEL